jgi:hypothetical protein
VIKIVSNLRQVGGYLRVLRFPPSIKLTATAIYDITEILLKVALNTIKASNYRIFKTKFEFEEYFNILNIGDAIRLCRFRTTNHDLPIETGRWRNIDRENRYRNLCNCQKLGDETTHFNHSFLLTFSVSHIYVNPHSFRIVLIK